MDPVLIDVSNIKGIVEKVYENIDYIFTSLGFIIALIGIVVQMKDITQQKAVNLIISVFVIVILILFLPTFATDMKSALKTYSSHSRDTVEHLFTNLMKLKAEGGILDSVSSYFNNIIFQISIQVATAIRFVVQFFIDFIFKILTIMAPVLLAFLAIPQKRNAAINYITQLFGFAILPVCFLFGDILGLKLCGLALALSGVAGATAGTGAAVSITTLTAATGGTGGLVIVGASGIALAVFGVTFCIITFVLYVGIPWAILSLLRGNGIMHPMVSTANAGANLAGTANRALGKLAQNEKLVSQAGKVGGGIQGAGNFVSTLAKGSRETLGR